MMGKERWQRGGFCPLCRHLEALGSRGRLLLRARRGSPGTEHWVGARLPRLQRERLAEAEAT